MDLGCSKHLGSDAHSSMRIARKPDSLENQFDTLTNDA